MEIYLQEVLHPQELRQFVFFPHQLYRENPFWVPGIIHDELNTLLRHKNPSFEYCEARYWMAYRGGKIVGRVAGIINHRHIDKWGQKYIRFGWLDFVNDIEVSVNLLGTVENWALERGLQAVHGPLGFTNLDHSGMLVYGFDELATMATIYNYPYYSEHLERLGYSKHVDWVEYEFQLDPEPNEKITRIADLAKQRYKLHLIIAKNKRELLPYAGQLFDIYNEEYRNLYSAVPLSKAQVQNAIRQYFTIISPKFVPVILNEQGKMVAFGIVLPSLSRALQRSGGRLFPFGFLHILNALKRNDRADLYLVAVKKEYQGKGVNAILMDYIHRLFLILGIERIESNPELELNTNVQGQWKYYQKRQHKRRRAYIKYLSAAGGNHDTATDSH